MDAVGVKPLKWAFNRLFARNRAAHLDNFLAAYGEEGRHYHNVHHVVAMVDALLDAEDRVQDFDALLLAAIYHDYVYDPRAPKGENERLSAEKVIEIADDLKRPELRYKVADYILATADHRPAEGDLALFLDSDLLVFASPEFDALDDAVREEYSWVPWRDFIAGRRAVLKSFIAREAVYTSFQFEHLNDAARRNLDSLVAKYDSCASQYADMVDDWEELPPDEAAAALRIASDKAPYSTGGSLHIHEETYLIHGRLHRILTAVGEEEPISVEVEGGIDPACTLKC